jgi:hypothetical protein
VFGQDTGNPGGAATFREDDRPAAGWQTLPRLAETVTVLRRSAAMNWGCPCHRAGASLPTSWDSSQHRQHRSSIDQVTAGIFRRTSVFTGTRLVITSAQVGFQSQQVQHPQLSR